MKFLLKTWFFSIFWLLVSQALAQSGENKQNLCSSWNVLRFGDGSQSCMTEYKFFTVRHIAAGEGIAPLAKDKKDFSIALTKSPNKCSVNHTAWSWNSASSQEKAIQDCQKTATEAVLKTNNDPKDCDCELIYSYRLGDQPNVPFSKKEFEDKIRGWTAVAQNNPIRREQFTTQELGDNAKFYVEYKKKLDLKDNSEIQLTQNSIEKERTVSLRKDLEKEIRASIQNENMASQSPQNTKAMPTIFANRRALVIGNDSYKQVPALLNAREDAKMVAETLNSLGYKVSLGLDVTQKQFKSELRTFKSQVQAGDEVAIFYAGHGVQIASTNYLLPIDITGQNEEEIKDDGISLQRLLDDMTEKNAKFTLAIIDACRDNPFKGSGRSVVGGRGLAPTTAATGQMIVFSAGTGQQALDKLVTNNKNKNGLFTRIFIKEMQKTGFTVDRVVRNVRTEVVSLAKSVGHEQVPAIYDQVIGDFFFKR